MSKLTPTITTPLNDRDWQSLVDAIGKPLMGEGSALAEVAEVTVDRQTVYLAKGSPVEIIQSVRFGTGGFGRGKANSFGGNNTYHIVSSPSVQELEHCMALGASDALAEMGDEKRPHVPPIFWRTKTCPYPVETAQRAAWAGGFLNAYRDRRDANPEPPTPECCEYCGRPLDDCDH